ncbi:MAG: hypothetical protein Q7S40_13945 [Opitutaceae bacterium]|nr:hypothetical protein [Opitutaceae bacterium]
MHDTAPTDSRSQPSSVVTIARAEVGTENKTAQPPLTSGFGAVLEQERDLHSSTERYQRGPDGPHSAATDSLLCDQQLRLRANIALLEQRYELLPHPTRFEAWRGKAAPLPADQGGDEKGTKSLPALIAGHRKVLKNITTLIEQRPDGQRGELIMAEVARHHVQMAGTLTALLGNDDAAHNVDVNPIVAQASAPATPGTNVSRWENEGGAARPPVAPILQAPPPAAKMSSSQ